MRKPCQNSVRHFSSKKCLTLFASGLTIVELVLVIGLSAILFVIAPPLVFHGVKTTVFLPKAMAVTEVADEVTHQLIEGGTSNLAGQRVLGLRFAGRAPGVTTFPVWLAEPNRIGYVTSGSQMVLVRLDQSVAQQEVVRRSLPPLTTTCSNVDTVLPTLTEEVIPYQAQGRVRIVTTGPLFRYYNQSGAEIVTPGCPPSVAIRRIDVAFTAQTDDGSFNEGNASEPMTSSAAIRSP